MRATLLGLLAAVLFCVVACSSPGDDKGKNDVDYRGGAKVTDPELMAINEALSVDPNDWEKRRQRALYYIKNGQAAESLNDARILIRHDSTKADYWGIYGKALFANHLFNRADMAFRKGLSIDPGCVHCNDGLAELKAGQMAYKDAFSYVNEAIRSDEQYYHPYYIKGWIFLKTGDTAKAISSFRTAVELNPDFYDGFIMLGSLYYSAMHPLAPEYLVTASRVNPDNPEPHYFLGMYYQQLDSIALAMKQYGMLLVKDSTHAMAHYNRGYLYLTELEHPDSAIMAFTEAIHWNPNYYQAYYNRGLARAWIGKKEEASNDFKLALGIRPDFTPAAEELEALH